MILLLIYLGLEMSDDSNSVLPMLVPFADPINMEMIMGPDSQGGLRCNRGGCPTLLSPPSGSRTGWATYCRFLDCILYSVYVQFLNYYLNWLLLLTKSNPLLCNLPKANVEQYVLMLLFLSHLFCGPCGKESASQGVCLACQVSSA